VRQARTRLGELAAEQGRPEPPVTASLGTALAGDPDLPGPDELTRRLTDPDGMFGIPASLVPGMLNTGPPAQVASRLAEHADQGINRVVISVAAGNWFRQVELVAQARDLLGSDENARGSSSGPTLASRPGGRDEHERDTDAGHGTGSGGVTALAR
jgi:hypothetical protein